MISACIFLKAGRSFSKSRQIILKGEWSASDLGHIIQKYEKCAPKLGDVSTPGISSHKFGRRNSDLGISSPRYQAGFQTYNVICV